MVVLPTVNVGLGIWTTCKQTGAQEIGNLPPSSFWNLPYKTTPTKTKHPNVPLGRQGTCHWLLAAHFAETRHDPATPKGIQFCISSKISAKICGESVSESSESWFFGIQNVMNPVGYFKPLRGYHSLLFSKNRAWQARICSWACSRSCSTSKRLKNMEPQTHNACTFLSEQWSIVAAGLESITHKQNIVTS